ncbi:ABC transporter permease [Aurantimonas coralicida]|uniref:ABC transporter permease n=1 Tax=Aurantimonas coralicida TaxID=182270 RepID=UPI001E42DB2A|nr:ABC transporter permease [Aurantimonas coralicida]MCD1645491.1 ABC transporter permease [Aurantimonas coralicida]
MSAWELKALPTPIVTYDADTYRRTPIASTARDLIAGAKLVELWGTMGWLDMRQRYRRSVMGPFWVTLSLAAFVLGLGITYGAIFGMPLADYLPYLSVGIVIWTLLSGFLLEGCQTFTGSEAAIKQMPAPLCIHLYRLLWRSLIIFFHNMIIIVAVLLIFGVNPGWTGLLAIPGLLVVLLNGGALGLLLGTLSARFRDIPPLIGNLVQMLFFVTPVIWQAEALGDRRIIAEWNPLYHMIELVRAPLLHGPASTTNWIIASLFTAASCVLAFGFYARFRWRIPYWL